MIEIEINEQNLFKFISNIRQEDWQELNYFIKDNLIQNFIDICLRNKQNSYFLASDSTPIAIGGVCDYHFVDLKVGQIWLLCANGFEKEQIYLYKYVKNKISCFCDKYDVLFNYIYKSNFNALKWLKRMGFSSCELKNNDLNLFYLIKEGVYFDIRCFTCE